LAPESSSFVRGHKSGEFTDLDQALLAKYKGPVTSLFSYEIWSVTGDAEFLDRSSPCDHGSRECVLTRAETTIEQENLSLTFVAGDGIADGARIARGGQVQGKLFGSAGPM
jgi:hypothetical protein